MSSRRMTCVLPSASISSIGGLRLGREQAVEDPAVVGRDGVLDEVPLDAPARVEDVDQQFLLGVRGHPGQVGADLAPLAAVGVALGALVLEDLLPLGGVAAFRSTGASSSMTFWRSASGRPPPCFRGLGPGGDAPGSGGRRGPASGRARVRESETFPASIPSTKRRRPVGAAEQGPDAPRAGRRVSGWVVPRPGSGRPSATRFSRPPRPGPRPTRRRARGDQLEQVLGGGGIDSCGTRSARRPRRPGGVGLLLVPCGRQEPAAISPDDSLQALAPQRFASVTSWPRASGESLVRSATHRLLGAVVELDRLPVLGPALREPCDDGVGDFPVGPREGHDESPSRRPSRPGA